MRLRVTAPPDALPIAKAARGGAVRSVAAVKRTDSGPRRMLGAACRLWSEVRSDTRQSCGRGEATPSLRTAAVTLRPASYAERRLRPLTRRALSTAWPARSDIRWRKP